MISKYTDAAFIKKKIAFRFSKIPVLKYLRLNRIQQLQIENLFDFTLEKSTLTKNPLLSVRVGFRFYYGPEDLCKNITVEEFVNADHYYLSFANTKKPEYIDKLIATLWRPTNLLIRLRRAATGRDIRESFNDKMLDRRAKKISRMSQGDKLAVLFFFVGFRSALPENFPLVFKEPTETTLKTEPAAWPNIIIEMSGAKYGKPEEVEQMRFWNFCYILNKNEVDRLKAEKEAA